MTRRMTLFLAVTALLLIAAALLMLFWAKRNEGLLGDGIYFVQSTPMQGGLPHVR